MAKIDKILPKKAFIEAYGKTFGNISQSCQAANISRQTYYNWIEEDEKFANDIRAIQPEEILMDFVESKLVQKINSGDVAALIFVAKCKGKRRGYVERTELTGPDGNQAKFEITLKI